ncbi:MAG: hypothetical protein NTU47_03105 [Ignavibacteriales bacterium]|nr:hypothetical protein [Ignavibacteriales bacterium]
MNKSGNRSLWMVLLYFVLSLAFAVFAIVASHAPNVRYMPTPGNFGFESSLQWIFWLLIVLSIVCLIPLLDAILRNLHVRRLLPRVLSNLYGDQSSSEVDGFLLWLKSNVRTSAGRLFAAGIAVFATVFILSLTSAVRERDVDSYLYEYISRLIRSQRSLESPPPSVCTSLYLNSGPGANELQDCLKVVEDLKKVGARAILVDIRGQNKGQEMLEWLRKIENTGVAVFGLSDWGNIRRADSIGEIRFTKGRMTMQPLELRLNPFVFRIKPEGISRYSDEEIPDIVIQLLRKYRNYSSDLELRREGRNVVFGDYRIPVSSDGWMYARQLVNYWPWTVASREGANDTLEYRGWFHGRKPFHGSQLDEIRSNFDGKIVLIERFQTSTLEYGWLMSRSYESAINSIVAQTVIVRSEQLHVWLTLVCIALAGLVASKVRPIPSFLTIFAIGLLVLLGSWLIYYKLFFFIDIFYPLLAVGMSMFVFPAIRAADNELPE